MLFIARACRHAADLTAGRELPNPRQIPEKPLMRLPGSEEVTVTASRTEEEVAFVPSSVTILT